MQRAMYEYTRVTFFHVFFLRLVAPTRSNFFRTRSVRGYTHVGKIFTLRSNAFLFRFRETDSKNRSEILQEGSSITFLSRTTHAIEVDQQTHFFLLLRYGYAPRHRNRRCKKQKKKIRTICRAGKETICFRQRETAPVVL